MESGTRYVLLIRTETRFRFITTILVKTSGTLCLSSKQNAIQVNPPPPWTVLMERVKHPLHILHMLWTSRIAALSYRAIFI